MSFGGFEFLPRFILFIFLNIYKTGIDKSEVSLVEKRRGQCGSKRSRSGSGRMVREKEAEGDK